MELEETTILLPECCQFSISELANILWQFQCPNYSLFTHIPPRNLLDTLRGRRETRETAEMTSQLMIAMVNPPRKRTQDMQPSPRPQGEDFLISLETGGGVMQVIIQMRRANQL